MGGGKNTCTTENEQVKCQMCADEGHNASGCQWVYSHCPLPNCCGMMMMLTSKEHNTYENKYLQCHIDKCKRFQWLEDAMFSKSQQNYGTSASSSQSNACFHCEEGDHWVSSCPWKESPCPNGCQGTRKLWISRQKNSYGKKFLKCLTCDSFEWLATATAKRGKVNVRVKVKVSLDELCNDLKRKI